MGDKFTGECVDCKEASNSSWLGTDEKRQGSMASPSREKDINYDVNLPSRVIVIMGVSGSGKTTIGQRLAEHLNWAFLDGDDFHPQANIDKMRQGIALSDEDRDPWLLTLRDLILDITSTGKSAILACSALKRSYRQVLRSRDQHFTPSRVSFICLEAPLLVLAERLDRRSMTGSHFMPSGLLQSQLDLLQVDDEEVYVLRVDSTRPIEDTLSFIMVHLI